MFGISIWQLLIILLIVVLLFGTKKLKNLGSDVGGAVKGFKDAVKDGEKDAASNAHAKKIDQSDGDIIEGQASKEDKKNETKSES